MKKEKKIKVGFPIGAIQDEIIDFFEKAGYEIHFHPEFEKIGINDPEIECVPLRPISIAAFVKKGILDAGVTTQASLFEIGLGPKDLAIILEDKKAVLGKTKIVLAVSENSKFKSIKGLKGKRVITRIPNIARKFFKKKKVKAEIIFSDTLVNESKVGNIADAVVEFSKTGNILRAYNLKILDTILESSAVLVANKRALKNGWKNKKIKNLANVLKGALNQKLNELLLWEPDLKGLDEIDYQIVKILSENGRESFVDIAQKINLSPVAVKQRVEKLTKKELLKIRASLNAEKFYSVSCQIMIEASNDATSWLIRKLKNSPLVYQLVKTSGRHNLIVGIMAQNVKRADTFVAREIMSEPGVKSVEVRIGEMPIIPDGWNPVLA